jgi:hypothetical protein
MDKKKNKKNERKKILVKRLQNWIKFDKKKKLDCLKQLLEGISTAGQCTEHDGWSNGRGSFRRRQTRDVERSGRRTNRFLRRVMVTSFKFTDVAGEHPPPHTLPT